LPFSCQFFKKMQIGWFYWGEPILELWNWATFTSARQVVSALAIVAGA
jgi:hypothetical protein